MSTLLWKWPTALHEGRLVRRYERFIADIRLGSREVRAHCVNPGRMEGLVIPGAKVWVSEAPGRKLEWTWVLIEVDGQLVGADTALPNRLVGELLARKWVPGFEDALSIQAEKAFGRGHRVDFLVEQPQGAHYVEVKNCHLVYADGFGYFPDSVSERATAHVEALQRRVSSGDQATVLFTVQRADAQAVRPSAFHDVQFATALRRAAKRGLSVRAVRFVPTLEGIYFDTEIPVDLGEYALAPVRTFSAAYDSTSGWQRKDGRWAGQTLRQSE